MKNQYFVLFSVVPFNGDTYRAYVSCKVTETAEETIRSILDEVIDSSNDNDMLDIPIGAEGRQMINIVSVSKLN